MPHLVRRSERFPRISSPWLPSVCCVLPLCCLLLAGCGTTPSATAEPRPVSTIVPVVDSSPTVGLAEALPPRGLRPSDVPTVVATVQGKPVPTWLYLSQVNFQLSLQEKGASAPVTNAQLLVIEQQALTAVIESELLVAYGEAHGWSPSSRQVDDAYARVIQRRGGVAASRAQVAREFLHEDQDRQVMRNGLVTERVLASYIDRLHQPVVAVAYRMIVVKTQQEATRVRAQLLRTDAWVALAQRYSIDAVGKAAGGTQPIAQKGTGDPLLRPTLFSLPLYQLSAPLRRASGWAVLEVTQRLPEPALYQQDLQAYYTWAATLRHAAHITSYIPLPDHT